MSKFPIKSVFEQIAEKVFVMRDVKQAQSFVSEFISDKGINDVDKRTILNNVNNCKNITALQRYICNSLLRFEGMSVNKRTTEPTATAEFDM